MLLINDIVTDKSVLEIMQVPLAGKYIYMATDINQLINILPYMALGYYHIIAWQIISLKCFCTNLSGRIKRHIVTKAISVFSVHSL